MKAPHISPCMVSLCHRAHDSSVYACLYISDPPVINETRSSAVMISKAPGEESAVLECVVKSVETLEVWINWTAGSEYDPLVEGDYTVGSSGGIYFLLLHRVTEAIVHPYTCQLFSRYSPTTPEDQQTLNITVVGIYRYLFVCFHFIYCSVQFMQIALKHQRSINQV